MVNNAFTPYVQIIINALAHREDLGTWKSYEKCEGGPIENAAAFKFSALG